MKVLFVCSKNSGRIAPFIAEQANALSELGVTVEYLPIEKKGIRGYLSYRKPLINKIKEFQPQLVHAHFGLSGLLANLQRKIPVVTTYHGCDINQLKLRIVSTVPLLLSSFNNFVSQNQLKKVRLIAGKHSVLPCGIDLKDFYPQNKKGIRKKLGWKENEKVVLFCSSYGRPEKNAAIALEALKLLSGFRMIELDGYGKPEMRELMNACDLGLMTSIREGSPMFIKEMIACKRPLVSTDVGDVKELIDGVKGCWIVPSDPKKIANAIEYASNYDTIDYPSTVLQKIDNKRIAAQLLEIYKTIAK